MSDNKNTSIQDRGWNKMRSILDKELPEKEKKRRRGVWFFYGFATIALFMLMSLFVFTDQDKKSNVADIAQTINVDEINNNDVKVIPQEENNSPQEQSSVSEINDQKETEPKTQVNLSSKEEIKNNKNSENLVKPKYAENLRESTTKIASAENILPPRSNRSIQKENAQNQPEKFVSPGVHTNQPIPVQPSVKPLENKNISTEAKNLNQNRLPLAQEIFPLPIFEIPFLMPSKIEMELQIIEGERPITPVKSKNEFSPYIFAMTNYQSKSSAFGLGLGLSYGNADLEAYIEASFANSKFNKESKSSASLDLEASPIIGVVEVEDVTNQGVLESNTYEISFSNFSKLTTSTDELKLGVGLRKKLYNNFKVDIGVTYSKLLDASNKSININLDEFSNFTVAGIYKVNSRELYDVGVYSGFDIVPHIAIEYALSSRIFLNLSYNHGLKNLISKTNSNNLMSLSSNDVIYRRNIGAKVRYQF